MTTHDMLQQLIQLVLGFYTRSRGKKHYAQKIIYFIEETQTDFLLKNARILNIPCPLTEQKTYKNLILFGKDGLSVHGWVVTEPSSVTWGGER